MGSGLTADDEVKEVGTAAVAAPLGPGVDGRVQVLEGDVHVAPGQPRVGLGLGLGLELGLGRGIRVGLGVGVGLGLGLGLRALTAGGRGGWRAPPPG